MRDPALEEWKTALGATRRLNRRAGVPEFWRGHNSARSFAFTGYESKGRVDEAPNMVALNTKVENELIFVRGEVELGLAES